MHKTIAKSKQPYYDHVTNPALLKQTLKKKKSFVFSSIWSLTVAQVRILK
jgi:hypothetical protein